jgi:hypothetical protein
VPDVLEPARTVADLAVLEFASEETISPGDFALTPEGVVRLHPQLARRTVEPPSCLISAHRAIGAQLFWDCSRGSPSIRRPHAATRDRGNPCHPVWSTYDWAKATLKPAQTAILRVADRPILLSRGSPTTSRMER